MKLYEIHKQQFIPRPRSEVFEFFSKPEHLTLLTPPGLGFHILTPVPIGMDKGALIDYTIRVAGVPVRWTTLITLFDPPARFVDVQLKGPYAYWHHVHEFSAVDGGTEMSDTVRYGIPAGVLGGIVQKLFVKRQLEQIFNYREEQLKKILPPRVRSQVSRQQSRTRGKKQ